MGAYPGTKKVSLFLTCGGSITQFHTNFSVLGISLANLHVQGSIFQDDDAARFYRTTQLTDNVPMVFDCDGINEKVDQVNTKLTYSYKYLFLFLKL